MAKEKEKRKAFEHKKKETQTEIGNIQEHINQVQRIQAEFENYKKRTEKEKELHTDFTKACLIKDLLPILDSFNLAIKSLEENKEIHKGIKLVYSQLNNLMEKQGLQEIKAIGYKLDPFKHEVLQQKESNEEDNVILEEIQKGYMFKDKVLRTSKVIINKNIGGK